MNKKNTINVLSQIQLQVSEFDLQGWVEHNKGLTIFFAKIQWRFFPNQLLKRRT